MAWEIGVIIGLSSAIVLFVVLALTLGEEHLFLKIFSLLFSFLLVGVGLYIIKRIADANYSASVGNILNSVFIGYMSVFLFVFFYFMIKIVFAIVSTLNAEKNKTGLEEVDL